MVGPTLEGASSYLKKIDPPLKRKGKLKMAVIFPEKESRAQLFKDLSYFPILLKTSNHILIVAYCKIGLASLDKSQMSNDLDMILDDIALN